MTRDIEYHSNFADVSVIVPAFESEDTIGRALHSIAAQTLKPTTVIVVDDGSSDNTYDAAKQFLVQNLQMI